MTPVHAGCQRARGVIAAQAVIGGDLVGAQQAAHGQVIFEMRIAKLALQPADVGQDTMQPRVIDATTGERLVSSVSFARTSLPSGMAVFCISSNSACVRPR